MRIEEWLESIDYKVVDGAKFEWKCYGENAYAISWQFPLNDYDNVIDYYSTVRFDTETKDVYSIEVIDENNSLYYGWYNNVDSLQKYQDECDKRQVSILPDDYDSIIILDSEREILSILRSFKNGITE